MLKGACGASGGDDDGANDPGRCGGDGGYSVGGGDAVVVLRILLWCCEYYDEGGENINDGGAGKIIAEVVCR